MRAIQHFIYQVPTIADRAFQQFGYVGADGLEMQHFWAQGVPWGSYKGVDVWAYVYTRDEWAGFPASVPTPTTGGFPNPNWNWATSSLGRFLNFGNGDEAATIMGKLDLIQGGLIVALEVATSLIDLESPEALAGAA
jgi:hypothetical protein